jgi:hypothetical protein
MENNAIALIKVEFLGTNGVVYSTNIPAYPIHDGVDRSLPYGLVKIPEFTFQMVTQVIKEKPKRRRVRKIKHGNST